MTETLTIELPDLVSTAVRRQAADRGISAEAYLAEIAALHSGDAETVRAYFAARAARADWGAFDKLFGRDRAGGEPPREGDELP